MLLIIFVFYEIEQPYCCIKGVKANSNSPRWSTNFAVKLKYKVTLRILISFDYMVIFMISGNTIAAELHGEVGWPVFTFHVLHQITTLIEDYGMTRLENHLLTMVNQNILKDKTSSGMQGVNNEWCTLLHLLSCCLLSQAHLQSSWGSTKKKG
uniref:Uncharacterized protein n=1 Tax=Lactuca sativa TaxID=4236 RepID=A0A9R1W7Z3_LACSA|nr:hypothetical protein LSAT_V11C300118790 [Lactuca sativa]